MSLIYLVKCQDCGGSLDFIATMDPSEDVTVEVEACENCKSDSYNEGYEDREAE